jgi:hypothetical protein
LAGQRIVVILPQPETIIQVDCGQKFRFGYQFLTENVIFDQMRGILAKIYTLSREFLPKALFLTIFERSSLGCGQNFRFGY